MTSAFSWQNSTSLFPASFCTPRPNMPVTPGVSQLPTFAFQSPIMKRTSFGGLLLESLIAIHRTIQLQLLQRYWQGGQTWITVICEWFAQKGTEIILSFLRLYPSTAFQTLVDHDGMLTRNGNTDHFLKVCVRTESNSIWNSPCLNV